MASEKQQSNDQASVDRISDLPWDMLDIILVQLPLKEAVRTSVLSTKWRHNWTRLSQFVIDDNTLPDRLDTESRWRMIEKIFNQVHLNNTPIEKFKLAAYCQPDHSALLQWIEFLFGNGLKELMIQRFSSPMRFKLPLHAYSCRYLTRLELFGCCVLDEPKEEDSFEEFVCLTSLKLDSVRVKSAGLECLISKCPNLERLVLVELGKRVFLKLHRTKLRYLKISSVFKDMCLKENPFLETVDIHLIPPRSSPLMIEDSRLVRIIGCLQSVERLALTGEFLEFLAERHVPDRLPDLLENLKELELKEVLKDNLKQAKVSFCLLKSFPNLEELHISVSKSFDPRNPPLADFLEPLIPKSLHFNRLKVLKLRGTLSLTFALNFIKKALAYSPLLETLTVILYNQARIPDELLIGFQRASQHVKIVSLATKFW